MTECPSKDAAWCHRKPHWLRNLDRVSPVPWVSVSLSVKLGLQTLVKNKQHNVPCTVCGTLVGIEGVSTLPQATQTF